MSYEHEYCMLTVKCSSSYREFDDLDEAKKDINKPDIESIKRTNVNDKKEKKKEDCVS